MRLTASLFSLSGLLLAGASLPALAQETTDAEDLQTVIESLQSGTPDYADMEPPLEEAVRNQEATVGQFLDEMGAVQEIVFEETLEGIDVYQVSFENGDSVWQMARSGTGRIAYLYVQAL